ncbi:MAG: Gfo/Idh/MocA family oxidoreductase [Gemmatimonadetes bacterium]|nr:Gfo/Idh/MocA family oxidoreductase [Gemmatimonadota bacterium]
MSAPLRVGVIGTGALGYHHLRHLRSLDGATVTGFYETDAARAAKVSTELGAAPAATLEALLDAVDAVSIAVPTPAHFAVAKAALSRGKHVLIEKPITTTLAEADELLALAKGQGALVQIGHIERFNRAIRAAWPYVDEPLFIESERLAPFNPRGSDVAVVLDLMIHDIDLVLTLTRAKVTEVRAAGVGILTPSVDIADARVAFANGAIANISASRISRDRTRKLRLFQRNAYLTLDLGAGSGELFRLRSDVNLAALATQAQPDVAAFVERIPLEAPEGDALRLELESFVAAVRGGAPVPVTGEDGRDALAVALQIVGDIERSRAAMTAARSASARTTGA